MWAAHLSAGHLSPRPGPERGELSETGTTVATPNQIGVHAVGGLGLGADRLLLCTASTPGSELAGEGPAHPLASASKGP